MRVLDVNILLYAINKDAPLHRDAKTWLERTLSSSEVVGLSWNVLLAFIRLTTRPGLFRQPLPLATAFELAASWLDNPSVAIIHPGPRHLDVLRDLLTPIGTGGNLTSDAHLAALAVENGAELCSCDGDFGRFPGLRWENPIG